MTSTPNPRRRPLRLGRKTAAGGIVVALIALGMWLASLLPGLGLGFGSGSGFGPGTATRSKSQAEKEQPKPFEPSNVVIVRVEADQYLLQQTVDGKPVYRAAKLDDVVALARKAPGDKSGMKVQMLVGRIPAEPLERLKKALIAAGIDANAIVQRNAWE